MNQKSKIFSSGKNKIKGQIWVETVIYTLIAFVLIGAVLAFVKPKIEEIQDKTIIEQSIEVLNNLESKISEIRQGGTGNKREIELKVKKGVLKIDGVNDKLTFEIESKDLYSQPGEEVQYGNIIIYTEEKGNTNIVNLTRDYSESYDLKYNGADELKLINPASIPYKIFISNSGKTDSITIINFEIA
ncbi:MAG: hypothetical protein ABH804_00845 [archaeon]